jgi:hypothetical protein
LCYNYIHMPLALIFIMVCITLFVVFLQYSFISIIIGIIVTLAVYIFFLRSSTMSKWKTFFILIAIFLVISMAGTIYVFKQKGLPPSFQPLETITVIEPHSKEECVNYSNAGKNHLSSTFLFNQCLTKLAINTGDPTICALTSSSSELDSCYVSYAVRKKEHKTCATVIDSLKKDSCYISTAQSLKDTSVCAHVASISKKKYCIDSINNMEKTPNI